MANYLASVVIVLALFGFNEVFPQSRDTLIDNVVNRQTRQAVRECETEDGKQGTCISLTDCSPYITRFNSNPKDIQFIQLLQRSNRICKKPRPVICCPNESGVDNQGTADSDTTPQRTVLQTSESVLPGFEEDCGTSNTSVQKIVGGSPAMKNAYPWIALIAYEDSTGNKHFRCAGSLITKRHILTAAHCINGKERFARLGEHNLTTDSESPHQDVNIARTIAHPNYDKFDKHSDIAIIYLERELPYTDIIHPICLPFAQQFRNKNYVGFNPIAIGWGNTQKKGNSSNVLLQIQLPIVDNNVCLLQYRAINALKSSKQFDNAVLCAGVLSEGMDTCQGDSGGPLMVAEIYKGKNHFMLTGIVSNGRGCGSGIPGLYTRVQSFIDWIEEKIAEPVSGGSNTK